MVKGLRAMLACLTLFLERIVIVIREIIIWSYIGINIIGC